jgi:hypothetical protein
MRGSRPAHDEKMMDCQVKPEWQTAHRVPRVKTLMAGLAASILFVPQAAPAMLSRSSNRNHSTARCCRVRLSQVIRDAA